MEPPLLQSDSNDRESRHRDSKPFAGGLLRSRSVVLWIDAANDQAGTWAFFVFNFPTGLAPGAIEQDPMRFIGVPIRDWSLAAGTDKRFEPLVFSQKSNNNKHNEAGQHQGCSNPFGFARDIQV